MGLEPTTLSLINRRGRGPAPSRVRQAAAGRRAANLLLERVALAAVAVRAEELQVLRGCRSAAGNWQDVVVLEVEVLPALDAPPSVAFKYEPPKI